MALALIILVGAALLALATGGSWASFVAVPIKARRLVVVAVVAQLLGSGLASLTNLHGFYPVGLGISAAAALAFCLRNIRLAGVPLITLGLITNALVVWLNGAMPVSIDAASRANVSIVAIAAGDDPRHTIAGEGSTWRTLGDDIPLPLPWRPEVVSPGDVLIAAGLGELVLLGMRPRRRARTEANSATREPAAVALG